MILELRFYGATHLCAVVGHEGNVVQRFIFFGCVEVNREPIRPKEALGVQLDHGVPGNDAQSAEGVVHEKSIVHGESGENRLPDAQLARFLMDWACGTLCRIFSPGRYKAIEEGSADHENRP